MDMKVPTRPWLCTDADYSGANAGCHRSSKLVVAFSFLYYTCSITHASTYVYRLVPTPRAPERCFPAAKPAPLLCPAHAALCSYHDALDARWHSTQHSVGGRTACPALP